MFDHVLTKIGTIILSLGIIISGWFGVTLPDGQLFTTLSGQLVVGGKTYTISGGGISSSQTTITLTNFDLAGSTQDLRISDFGNLGCGTIEPGHSTRQEFISFTGVTQNSDDTATLTGVVRGLQPVSPYTASTTLQYTHSGGSSFILSNSPPCFYESYANLNASSTISNLWTYKVYPEIASGVGNATTSLQFTTKNYVDNVVNQGAATSTQTLGGISELATQLEIASTTDLGVARPLVLHTLFSTSTPDLSATNRPNNYLVMSEHTGLLHPDWFGNLRLGTTTPFGGATFAIEQNGTSPLLSIGDTGTSTPFLFLDAKGNLGIGTTSPFADFAVNGSTTVNGFFMGQQAGDGKILTSNSKGYGTWESPSTFVIDAASTTALSVQNTLTLHTLFAYTVPANSIGINGIIECKVVGKKNNGNDIRVSMYFGGTKMFGWIANNEDWNFTFRVVNRNSASSQHFDTAIQMVAVDGSTFAFGAASSTTATINTATDQVLAFKTRKDAAIGAANQSFEYAACEKITRN